MTKPKETEHKTECVICTKEVNILEEFNGEMMCQECYEDEENYVFEGDADE